MPSHYPDFPDTPFLPATNTGKNIGYHGDAMHRERFIEAVKIRAERASKLDGFSAEFSTFLVGKYGDWDDYNAVYEAMGLMKFQCILSKIFAKREVNPIPFYVELAEAIPSGADLTLSIPRFVLNILDDNGHGIKLYTKNIDDVECINMLNVIIDLYKNWIDTNVIPNHELCTVMIDKIHTISVRTKGLAHLVADIGRSTIHVVRYGYTGTFLQYTLQATKLALGDEEKHYNWIKEQWLNILRTSPTI